ncbi:polyphosphoinositide phosphatase-like isoform X2 [Artemia franciscana]|nr:hypothetical protein QYM36_005068 [Artemia franciscana]KAK2719453.1 hypothetical protein QYM36_005068 [Artemia franciscana]
MVSAFGIVGFVHFLEGYYIILITKRRKIALIGHHTIYKIEDTSLVYIPNFGQKSLHKDESKYVRLFQSIDFSSNFYFSYSYDLTNTLQYNSCRPTEIRASTNDLYPEDFCWGVRSQPNFKFVWNEYLLKDALNVLHSDWQIFMTHGFVGQSNVSVFGKPYFLTLIARRSNKYSGTRFLKRGSNYKGDVANEVETEQIVHEAGVCWLNKARFTSFVQLRGSVPSQWSQPPVKIAKPPITIEICEPFAESAGAHYNQLLQRYGSPIIVINLVKKKEKKKHEAVLTDELVAGIRYLNVFLPSAYHINYVAFDMARMNKSKRRNVINHLNDVAVSCVKRTGIFQSKGPCASALLKETSSIQDFEKSFTQVIPAIRKAKLVSSETIEASEVPFRLQTGIVRVNCVDCLDRTNTAQFVVGKCALAFQFVALGVLTEPYLDFDSDCVRMLEELYEDHGDTLALQYGGSQMVHRIQTYRKTAPWTSQGNDIMQTLSRYYANTFSDSDKQNAINLFLGIFVPSPSKQPIWETITDYYLHHDKGERKDWESYTKWWDTEAFKYLPISFFEAGKICSEIIPVTKHDQRIDPYYEYYRPFELTVMTDTYVFTMAHSVRDFMPNFTTDFSPFSVRIRPGKRRDTLNSSKKVIHVKNPSLSGRSSASNILMNPSTDTSESSDESISDNENNGLSDLSFAESQVTYLTLLTSPQEVYTTHFHQTKQRDYGMYKKYTDMAKCCKPQKTTPKNLMDGLPKCPKVFPKGILSRDSAFHVLTPTVARESQDTYKKHIHVGLYGPSTPNSKSMAVYKDYVKKSKSSSVLYNKNNREVFKLLGGYS